MQGQNALQPGQLVQQQQQIEQTKRDLADQDAMTKSMQEWDGNYDTLPGLVMKHGGSAKAVMQLRSALVNQQKDLTGLNESQLTLADMKADHWVQALSDVAKAPPDQQPVLLEQAKANAVQKGWATPQEAQAVTYQNPQQLDALVKMAMGHKAAIAAVKTQAEADEATSKGQLAQAQIPEAQAKGGIEQIKLNMMKGGSIADVSSAIDQMVPQSDPVNSRYKIMAQQAMKTGGIEAASKIVDQLGAYLSSIDKETNPRVIGAKAQEAANTAQIGQNITQANRPSLAFDKDNRAHLLSQADAVKAGYTGITQASDKDIQDSRTHNVVLNDMQTKLNDVVTARKALDQGAAQRAIISKVLSHSEPGMINDFMKAGALKDATQLTKDYIITVQSLKESALGLPKEITGGARTSEIQGNALFQNLPSGASVDSKYALEQAQKFQANLDRLRDRVPQIRGMQATPTHPDLVSSPSGGTKDFSVKTPNGKTYTFKDQQSLNNFKAKAGIQ